MLSMMALLLQAMLADPRSLWQVKPSLSIGLGRPSFLTAHLIEQHTHVVADVTPLVRVALLGEVSVGRLDLIWRRVIVHLACSTSG